MSSPTGSEQNYPQGGAPQGGQPGWTPPPPQPPPAGYNPPGYNPPGYNPPGYNPAPSYAGGPPATGQRPGMVTAAGIIGIVWGALGTLFGLLGLLGASYIDNLGIDINAFDIILGLLGIAAAIALLVGGIQVLQGKAPKLLLLAAYAGLGLWLVGVIYSVIRGYGFSAVSLITPIVLGVIVFLLLNPQSKQHYASRGISY